MKAQKELPSVELNHLIILAKEKQKTADLLTRLLDLPKAIPADGPVPGFFLCIQLKNDVMLLIAEAKEHSTGHYAFKVPPDEFERVIHRLKDWKIDYWADPRMQRPAEYYVENGNKGLYFIDPSGHGMEILTPISDNS
ncbi:VOC family protein [Salmonirosea aquatica]|uniref:VOC family protein n=1 Tax=Salmonirosea aquatica TaxID=2654236 RepID=A0A7C9BB39_9BACT|nr:VOC family protein [Cytophagaceae bacterium SJW1-29]